MATIAGDAPYEERSLFVRKATGLVRGWSVHDAFIYATFSINLITLGLYIFADGPFIPKGSLLLAIILSGAYLVFQTIVYAALIAVMPRAGGDYVWVSRVIGGGIGFVLAVCGWWFINWHWVPIYANILVEGVLPAARRDPRLDRLRLLLERAEGHLHRVGDHRVPRSGVHLDRHARLREAAEALLLRRRARPAIIFGLLIFHSKSAFQGAFNHYAVQTYGATTPDAYAADDQERHVRRRGLARRPRLRVDDPARSR